MTTSTAPTIPTPPSTKTPTFAAFQSRAFATVWAGGFVSNIGTWMQAAALGYYTAHLTKSAAWSAAVAAGEFAPTALLGPIGGALADRYSRKMIFIVVTIAQGVLAGILTIIMATGKPGAPVIALYALANGCTFALGFPAFQSVLPELVKPEALSSAIGLSSASWNLGRVVGPSLSVALYHSAGISWILGINALSFAAVLVALFTIRVPKRTGSKAGIFESILQGFRFVRAEPGLRIMVQSLCWNTLWVSPFIGLIPAMVEKEFHAGDSGVGWLIAAQGAGAVVTGVTFAKMVDRFGVRRLMVGSMTALPIALIAYGLSPNVWFAIPALFFTGMSYFGALSSFSNIAQLRAPSELRGRVISVNQVVLGTFYAIALTVQGQLGDRIGVRVVTVTTAVIALVGLLAVRILSPGITDAITGAPQSTNA